MKPQYNHLKTFAAIKAFMSQHPYSPSQKDLMELTGVHSPGTICRHLITLQAEGCIRRKKYTQHSIELTGIEPDPHKVEEPVLVVKVNQRSLFAKPKRRKSNWHMERAALPKLTEKQLQANIDKVVAKAKANEAFRQDHDIIHDYRTRFSGYTMKAHKL